MLLFQSKSELQRVEGEIEELRMGMRPSGVPERQYPIEVSVYSSPPSPWVRKILSSTSGIAAGEKTSTGIFCFGFPVYRQKDPGHPLIVSLRQGCMTQLEAI
jgi:hypothetical protein